MACFENLFFPKRGLIYYFESMKIEDIEKACELYKNLEAINEVLELKLNEDILIASFLVLFHRNTRYDLNTCFTEEAKSKIMNIIFAECEARVKQIKQQIEEL